MSDLEPVQTIELTESDMEKDNVIELKFGINFYFYP